MRRRSITITLASLAAQLDGRQAQLPLDGPRAVISVHPLSMAQRGAHVPASAGCAVLTRGGWVYAQEDEPTVAGLLEAATALEVA